MLFNEQFPVLAHFKSKGFEPKTIIDCGSHVGDWARMVQFLYPNTPIHLIDILDITRPDGSKADSDIVNRVNHYGALDEKPGEKILYHSETYPALTTLYKDTWNPEETFVPICVPTTTLDTIFETATIEAPILLKLDIQGGELAAIKGGKKKVLPKTDVIVCEGSYKSFNSGGPDLRETINELWELGFDLFEIVKCDFRTVLGPLFQCDAFFVSNRMNYLWQK